VGVYGIRHGGFTARGATAGQGPVQGFTRAARLSDRSPVRHPARSFFLFYIRTSLFDCNLSHPIRYVVVGDQVLCSDVVSVSVIESVFKALSRAINGVFERLECEYLPPSHVPSLTKFESPRDYDAQSCIPTVSPLRKAILCWIKPRSRPVGITSDTSANKRRLQCCDNYLAPVDR
jgi:hypothetical protein